MQDEPPVDPFLAQLCEGYTEAEVAEIERYIPEWDASTYIQGYFILISQPTSLVIYY